MLGMASLNRATKQVVRKGAACLTVTARLPRYMLQDCAPLLCLFPALCSLLALNHLDFHFFSHRMLAQSIMSMALAYSLVIAGLAPPVELHTPPIVYSRSPSVAPKRPSLAYCNAAAPCQAPGGILVVHWHKTLLCTPTPASYIDPALRRSAPHPAGPRARGDAYVLCGLRRSHTCLQRLPSLADAGIPTCLNLLRWMHYDPIGLAGCCGGTQSPVRGPPPPGDVGPSCFGPLHRPLAILNLFLQVIAPVRLVLLSCPAGVALPVTLMTVLHRGR